MRDALSLPAVLLLLSLSGCGEVAKLPESAGVGPKPTLPPPNHTLIPTVHIAPAKGWPAGVTPTAPSEKIVDLPAGPINHHWTKNVTANRDGSRLYVAVGSNSNVGENGIDNETSRAAVLEVDPAARTARVFASGLRNPNGLSWQPQSGALSASRSMPRGRCWSQTTSAIPCGG
jgi:hypothetical protein